MPRLMQDQQSYVCKLWICIDRGVAWLHKY